MESIKELRKICQNPQECHKSNSGLWHIYRTFSIYITKLLLYTPLKGNHVTMIMIFWGFIVGFLFSIGTYWYNLAGVIALQFLLVLDCVDGEVARYRKTPSLNGIFLDIIAHLINLSVPFIGLTIGIYKSNPSLSILVIGLLATLFPTLCVTIQAVKHHVIIKELVKYSKGSITPKKVHEKIIKKTEKENSLKSIGRMINYLYDGFYIIQIMFIAAIFNKLYWVLIFYGLTSPLMWLVKLIYEYKVGYKPYEYLLEECFDKVG